MGCNCKSSKSVSRPIVKKNSPISNGRRTLSGRIIKRNIK